MRVVIKVKKISEEAIIPSYAHSGDAGLDICSMEDIFLHPRERKRVRTGLKFELPEGYVGLIWDKSGLSFKSGIKTMAGVLDATYRGELFVVLVNLSDKDFEIKKGQKIAQMLVQKVEEAEILEVEELNETTRGESGFGSTEKIQGN